MTWVAVMVVVAIVLDQALKLYIRTHFMMGESREILPFFQLCFIENDGMAFGFGPNLQWFNKIFLTLFRIVVSGGLGWYLWRVADNRNLRTSYIIVVGLVLAGAFGNIIDCVFYGKLFGYETWFYGRVVDMLYFPLWTWPDWLPWLGGRVFFGPVFNLADSYITGGVIALLLFFRKEMDETFKLKMENGKLVESQKSKVESQTN